MSKKKFNEYVRWQIASAKKDGWNSVPIYSHLVKAHCNITIKKVEEYIMEFSDQYVVKRVDANILFYTLEWR
jgi:hypothetical protein